MPVDTTLAVKILSDRFGIIHDYMAERQMTHADWLISGLEKVILPSEEIHLALSCKHCSNKILKKLKLIMPYNDDENYSTSEYYYPEQTNDPNKYG